MPWYSLPPQHQKQVGSMIHWYQNGTVLTIGPFNELNYEAVSIVSITYKIRQKSQNYNIDFFLVYESNFPFHNVSIQYGQLI